MTSPAVPRWYLKKATVLVALTVMGPFGLLFLWKSPEFPRATKLVLTGITLTLAVLFMALTPFLIRLLEARLSAMGML